MNINDIRKYLDQCMKTVHVKSSITIEQCEAVMCFENDYQDDDLSLIRRVSITQGNLGAYLEIFKAVDGMYESEQLRNFLTSNMMKFSDDFNVLRDEMLACMSVRAYSDACLLLAKTQVYKDVFDELNK